MIADDLKAGDTLGRYEILMPVAKGGMATVWAARLVGSRGFQKVVAIKTIHPGMTDDEDFEAMLLDEARLASRIRHPHDVEIVDLGEEGDWLYLVMEWVSGETLFTINKRAKAKGGIPLPILLRILSGACAGLQAAHELRDDKGTLLDLVHRDISPQNIMVSFNGIVKVVDFGVAKAAGRSHETRVGGLMKGKVPYLSPEQLMGHKLDRRADIFSLGVLAYVMVTGRHPFKGETDANTMENICTRAPVSLRDLAPDTREDVEQIIMRALAKDPVDRWPDCAEMQRAVNQVLSSLGKPVTDGDVAKFIKEFVGDLIEDRNKLLAEAIARADAKAAAGGPKAAPKKKSGGGPLAVNAEGILAVVLDDGGAAAPEPVNLYTPTPAIAEAPGRMTVTPSGRPKKSGSVTPIIVGALALLLVGAGAAVKLGKVPWLAQMLGLGDSAPAASAAPAPSAAPTQSAAQTPPTSSAVVVPAVAGSAAPASAAASTPRSGAATLVAPRPPPQFVGPRPAPPPPTPVATSTAAATAVTSAPETPTVAIAAPTATAAVAAPAPTSAPTAKPVAGPASSGSMN